MRDSLVPATQVWSFTYGETGSRRGVEVSPPLCTSYTFYTLYAYDSLRVHMLVMHVYTRTCVRFACVIVHVRIVMLLLSFPSSYVVVEGCSLGVGLSTAARAQAHKD